MTLAKISFESWNALHHLVATGDVLPDLVGRGCYVELADVAYISTDAYGVRRVTTEGAQADAERGRLELAGAAPWRT